MLKTESRFGRWYFEFGPYLIFVIGLLEFLLKRITPLLLRRHSLIGQ